MSSVRDLAIFLVAVTGLVTPRVVITPRYPFPFTTPWVTTLPPRCQTVEGEYLFPGQQKTFFGVGACKICSCSYGVSLSCFYIDCLVPMCVDAERRHGDCCVTCPHGRNCRIPMTMEVMNASSPVVRQGMLCECPPQKFFIPGIQTEADYTAICTHITTLPTPPPSEIPVGRR